MGGSAGAGESAPAASVPASPPAAPAPPADPTAPVLPPLGAAGADPAPEPAPPPWETLELLGETVPPGETRRLGFESHDSFHAALVALRGQARGPTLCITAGVHGDELNGVAIARRLVDETDPTELRGTLVIVPIVNAHGFRNGSRYLPDRRDLNRYFPGRRSGSAASRIAYEFFERVVRRCDALIDLHTGSLNRTNLPQIRADLREVRNLRLAWGFGTEHVVHSIGRPGTLRRAAMEAGIPAAVYEAGEPLRVQPEEIELGVRGVRALLESLGMLAEIPPAMTPQHHYFRTHWVRADASGIYVPTVALGERVEPGEPLAEISDPFSSRRSQIRSPREGRVLGMALGQVVIPGFALFHIGEEHAALPGETGSAVQEAEPPAPDAASPMDAELVDERPE